MSDDKGARWFLILGALAVIGLVAGLFVVMSSDTGTSSPTPVETAADEPRPAADRPAPAPTTATGEVAPAPRPKSDKPPRVFDHSGQPAPEGPQKTPVAAKTKDLMYKEVMPKITACSKSPGQKREPVTIGFTVVAASGKVAIEDLSVGQGDGITDEETSCIKKAFEGLAFDAPEGQDPGRFPVTFAFSLP